ncbi:MULTISPECIES: M56 family metallopeptidase [unclassified Nocardia]|uniref:M56 family metallopeptidase n=1 Tax=unclassified Nocardia TaxID=2637762 RepID=UPI001CE438EF|nr:MULTISPECIES: M56 family metallopeptidase [unclassified Nocardia]
MTLAFALICYGSAVAVFGPPVLRRLTRRGSAPRLGVLAWLVAIAGALGAWVAATVVLVVEFAAFWDHPVDALRACLAMLSAPAHVHGGTAVQVSAFAVAAVVAAGSGGVLLRAGHLVLRLQRSTRAHGRAVRIVGRRVPGVAALVLDSPERQAYCVAGRPDTIVVTSAALDALTGPQLNAVLAHERAHLTGKHPYLMAVLRGLATALPVGLFTEGAAQIGRLLEMCADDRAAREHGPESLLGGLLAFAGGAAVPVGALGAAGTAVLARAERLADPVSRIRLATNRTALLAVIAVTVGGLLEVALGIFFCSTIFG